MTTGRLGASEAPPPDGPGRELARYPQLVQLLLSDHRPDDRGRCAGCRSANTLAPRWPCGIADLAHAAERFIAGEPDGGGCRR